MAGRGAAVWQKQQHTANRILDRLREEDGFDGSYSIVQRYIRPGGTGSVKILSQIHFIRQ